MDDRSTPTSAVVRRRTRRVVLFALGLLAVGVLYLVAAQVTGRGIPCPVYHLTGYACPGCGMTRALQALVRLDLAAAFGYNLLWPLYGAWAGWIAVVNIRDYIRRGTLPGLPGKLWIHLALCGVLVVYAVVRNVV